MKWHHDRHSLPSTGPKPKHDDPSFNINLKIAIAHTVKSFSPIKVAIRTLLPNPSFFEASILPPLPPASPPLFDTAENKARFSVTKDRVEQKNKGYSHFKRLK